MSAQSNQYCQLAVNAGLNNPASLLSGDYFGTLSGLSGTSPAQTFTISRGRFSVNVSTSASTVLYNSDGSANPTLSNGETVDVAGSFDTTNNVIDATAVIIEVNTQASPPVMAKGLVTSDSLTGNMIDMQLYIADGFQPTTTAMTVDITPTTTFVDSSGVTDTEAQFFANLTPQTTVIRVDGSISGSTITATSIKIVPPPGGGSTTPILVAVRGMASNVNATADTLTLTLKKWEGWHAHLDVEVSVTTTANTQYAIDGNVVSAAAFFASLTASSTVNVRGTLDPSTLMLTAAIVTQGSADSWGFHF